MTSEGAVELLTEHSGGDVAGSNVITVRYVASKIVYTQFLFHCEERDNE